MGGAIDGGPFDMNFVGTRADGSTVSAVVIVDNFIPFETYLFSDFDNVTSVAWRITTSTGVAYQQDDIIVDPVPMVKVRGQNWHSPGYDLPGDPLPWGNIDQAYA